MTYCRAYLKEAGVEEMLAETIRTGLRGGFIKPSDMQRVNVDTTVQEKNVRFPTDARLLDRSRERLVKRARAQGIALRQTHSRSGKRALRKQSGYAHAKQFKRARREEKRLRRYLGCVVRDIERKCNGAAWELSGELEKARRLLAQKKTDSNKLYSLHEPQVECIAKGKAHKRYEFGCKAGFVSPAKSNWIPGARAFHGNPYDGHTLAAALGQSGRLTGVASVIGFSMAGIVPFKWYFMPALAAYTWTAAWGLWAACGYLAAQWGAVRPGQRAIVRRAVLWGLPSLVVLWVAAGGLELLLTGREEWLRMLSSQETSYLRAADWVRGHGGAPGQSVVVGEVGALGWALPEFRVVDSSGINSRAVYQALLADHLRLEEQARRSSIPIPPDGSAAWVWQILRDRPDWIVSLKRFLHLMEIENTPEFLRSYRLVHTIENPPAQPVLIYRLQSGSKP